jgi:hypothetical protein
MLAPFVQRIIDLEEQRTQRITGLPDGTPMRCKDIPEEARFIETTLETDESEPGIGHIACSSSNMSWPGFTLDEYSFTMASVE